MIDECCAICENYKDEKCSRHVVYKKLAYGEVEKIDYPIDKPNEIICSFYQYAENFVHN